VGQLRNVLDRAVILCKGVLLPRHTSRSRRATSPARRPRQSAPSNEIRFGGSCATATATRRDPRAPAGIDATQPYLRLQTYGLGG
jgi:hypothetical protein